MYCISVLFVKKSRSFLHNLLAKLFVPWDKNPLLITFAVAPPIALCGNSGNLLSRIFWQKFRESNGFNKELI